jgi:predicted dehydrogenase
MPGRLRLAVVGAGWIGRQHIRCIRASTECELAAIVDPAAAARDLAAAAKAQWLSSLDDLLAGEICDGVIVASPNALHVPQGLACIAARLPALIEKPLAPSLDDGERLCAAAEAAGVPVLTGHHRQHSPVMSKAVEIVRSGTLGRLVALTGFELFYKPDSYFDEGPWRRDAGGGPILINLIHEIGNMRALAGEIVEVRAMTSNAVRGFAVEDTAGVLLRFDSGAIATLILSDTAAAGRSWEQTSGEDKTFASYPDDYCYLVTGTHGSLEVPTMRLDTFAPGTERSWRNPLTHGSIHVERADPLERQLANFCAVIRGDAAPVVSARDGLANLRAIDAIKCAAATGETVLL